jgi:molybdopterin molybdotransferase
MASDRPVQPPTDVRMRGFARRTTVEEALAWVDRRARQLPAERVSVWQAAGRVLAGDVTSDIDVPAFVRSMMDGFAVRAADCAGATALNRMELRIIGQSLPGAPFGSGVGPNEAIRIMTGAPLPSGCDAVLPAELTETDAGRLWALADLPPGKNVAQPAEDVAAGAVVLPAGRRLRPQDVGLLSSIGHSDVEVVRKPRVRLVITGNELLAAGSTPQAAQIADANGPMLAALVARDGGVPEVRDQKSEVRSQKTEVYPPSLTSDLRPLTSGSYIVPDSPAALLAALQSDADMVIVSGGSSVGQEDYAPHLLAEHGELAIHGIAMRPSSPTGMGQIQQRLAFLLPGNPVSCLCAYDFFAGRAIRLLGGRGADWPYRQVCLPLERKLVSQVGRVDYARVRIMENRVEPVAISGASILSSTTSADGFVIVPADSEGFAGGTEVAVFLYD